MTYELSTEVLVDDLSEKLAGEVKRFDVAAASVTHFPGEGDSHRRRVRAARTFDRHSKV